MTHCLNTEYFFVRISSHVRNKEKQQFCRWFSPFKAMCHTFLACLSRAAGSAIEAIFLALHSRSSVWHIALILRDFQIVRHPDDVKLRLLTFIFDFDKTLAGDFLLSSFLDFFFLGVGSWIIFSTMIFSPWEEDSGNSCWISFGGWILLDNFATMEDLMFSTSRTCCSLSCWRANESSFYVYNKKKAVKLL